ncbi:helix-turn-helix domain-containing protein [Flavobacterium cyclinae]|uniref:helix-turn-helix domain-containing protein n=1 Tax=Flavobacterium cyclinae TaxID=2895947 RepID=UPI001E58AEFF|nr:helix-turn-helix domain-containing protein [Flavobacterium cyclinae]UGS22086.1 helix-turn-helix domain-containing protein [Flavobacterium cyclinae]
MENPFELIMERLDRIERAIENLKTENAIVVESKAMNVSEVAKYLNTNIPSIYGLTSRAEIPHYKIAKKLYFKKEEIDEWINSKKIKTNQDIEKEVDEYLRKRKGHFR